MKKIILSLSVCLGVLLLSGCLGKSKNNSDDNKSNDDNNSNAIIEIPDANFKAYLLEKYDANNDGEISLSEAEDVKEINCSGREIKDLTGIEHFVNIESLDCSNNELVELEIRYNKKLNKLVCNDNGIPLFIYIGMSSPLKNQNIRQPEANAPSNNDMVGITRPLDMSKCTYDVETTNVMISFDD